MNDGVSPVVGSPPLYSAVDWSLPDLPQVGSFTPSGEPLQTFFARFDENSNRVIGLLRLHTRLKQANALGLMEFDAEERIAVDDVMRSAVVLNHAALEDFLRSMAASYLVEADFDAMRGIALADEDGPRNEKFVLGNLIQHKGKTIDEVIRQSVNQHLDRTSFSEVKDVINLLEKMGFSVKKLGDNGTIPADMDDIFAKMERMMKRRHQIVHKTDRETASGSGQSAITPLDFKEVYDGVRASMTFAGCVLVEALVKNIEMGRVSRPSN